MEKFRDRIDAKSSFARDEAELLLKFASHYPEKFKYLKSELTRQLEPYYEYEIKCNCCGRIYKHIRSKPDITQDEIDAGGECNSCEDDDQ